MNQAATPFAMRTGHSNPVSPVRQHRAVEASDNSASLERMNSYASVSVTHVAFSYSLCTDTSDSVSLKDIRGKTQKMSPKVKCNPVSFCMYNAYQRGFTAPDTEEKFHLPANFYVFSSLFFFPTFITCTHFTSPLLDRRLKNRNHVLLVFQVQQLPLIIVVINMSLGWVLYLSFTYLIFVV